MVIAKGCATSEPTSWTASPVVPVMSTARMEPPSARHVPTFTRTGAVDPDVAFTSAVPPKAGEPSTLASLSDPVLKMASSTEDVSGGTEVGAVTPGNPVTPVHVPTGSETALPRIDAAADAGTGLAVVLAGTGLAVVLAGTGLAVVLAGTGLVVVLDVTALVAPAPCGDVVAGDEAVAEGTAVPVAEESELEATALPLEAARGELDAEEPLGARKR